MKNFRTKTLVALMLAFSVSISYNEAEATVTSNNLNKAETLGQLDFRQAAANTINGVVSIKSYATPRQQTQGFNDPSFDFFRSWIREQTTKTSS